MLKNEKGFMGTTTVILIAIGIVSFILLIGLSFAYSKLEEFSFKQDVKKK